MKYSVIIPVYNAEKTIVRCLNSLLSQNYPDAEIIVVNDGSTDRSDMICRKFEKEYDQIVYISKENGGVSSARNAGLDIACGDYILFVDSDDYVTSDYFTALDQIPSEWDYVVFSYYVVNGDQMTACIRKPYYSSCIDDYFAKLSELMCRKMMNCPWNKRFKNDIIQKIHVRFHRDLSIGEDALFNFLYAISCSSCCLTEHLMYYVSVDNNQSLSRRPRSDKKEQLAVGECEMLETIRTAPISEANRAVLLSAMNFLQLSEIYSEAKRMHLDGVKAAPRRKEIRKLCREINRQRIALPSIRYCRLLALPVRFNLISLIDLIGWKLASG